jgi:hypothetical protein
VGLRFFIRVLKMENVITSVITSTSSFEDSFDDEKDDENLEENKEEPAFILTSTPETHINISVVLGDLKRWKEGTRHARFAVKLIKLKTKVVSDEDKDIGSDEGSGSDDEGSDDEDYSIDDNEVVGDFIFDDDTSNQPHSPATVEVSTVEVNTVEVNTPDTTTPNYALLSKSYYNLASFSTNLLKYEHATKYYGLAYNNLKLSHSNNPTAQQSQELTAFRQQWKFGLKRYNESLKRGEILRKSRTESIEIKRKTKERREKAVMLKKAKKDSETPKPQPTIPGKGRVMRNGTSSPRAAKNIKTVSGGVSGKVEIGTINGGMLYDDDKVMEEMHAYDINEQEEEKNDDSELDVAKKEKKSLPDEEEETPQYQEEESHDSLLEEVPPTSFSASLNLDNSSQLLRIRADSGMIKEPASNKPMDKKRRGSLLITEEEEDEGGDDDDANEEEEEETTTNQIVKEELGNDLIVVDEPTTFFSDGQNFNFQLPPSALSVVSQVSSSSNNEGDGKGFVRIEGGEGNNNNDDDDDDEKKDDDLNVLEEEEPMNFSAGLPSSHDRAPSRIRADSGLVKEPSPNKQQPIDKEMMVGEMITEDEDDEEESTSSFFHDAEELTLDDDEEEALKTEVKAVVAAADEKALKEGEVEHLSLSKVEARLQKIEKSVSDSKDAKELAVAEEEVRLLNDGLKLAIEEEDEARMEGLEEEASLLKEANTLAVAEYESRHASFGKEAMELVAKGGMDLDVEEDEAHILKDGKELAEEEARIVKEVEELAIDDEESRVAKEGMELAI